LTALFGSAAKPDGHQGSVITAREQPSTITYPYRLKASFLSPAEVAFQRTLASTISNRYTIFPKVRVLDLCDVIDRERNQAAFNRIDRKHLDFLLCDPVTFQPIVAIELDDSTHRRSHRADRDAFVDEVLRVIGLPLVRVRAQLQYDGPDLLSRVEAAATSRSAPKI
jgi:very-short-patch-repair endonuclease